MAVLSNYFISIKELIEISYIPFTNRKVKIIFLTAKGCNEEIAKGLALGANAYITKPFSNALLVAKVNEILDKTNLEAKE